MGLSTILFKIFNLVNKTTLGYLISVSVVWAILSVSDSKISTCTVSVSVWKKTIINVSVETKTVQSVIHS